MGKLIIAGEGRVELGPTFINYEEGKRWNSTVEGLIDLNTGYMTQAGGCTGPTAKNRGPRRFSTSLHGTPRHSTTQHP